MDDVLRRRQADAGERPAMAVLIGQIAAQGFGVAAAKVELRTRVGERPAAQSEMHAAGGVTGIDQAGEIKLLDLLIEQRIGPLRVMAGHPLGQHLQAADAAIAGLAVPAPERNAAAAAQIQDEIVAGLAERQIAVTQRAAQRQGVVGAVAADDGVVAVALVVGDDVSTTASHQIVVAAAAVKKILAGAIGERVVARPALEHVIARALAVGERVVAIVTLQQIMPGAAGQLVVALAAAQYVVAGVAPQNVIALTAVHRHVAVAVELAG